MKSEKKIDIDKILGEIFKEYRINSKLTQEKIAEKLGISIVTARHYMNYLETEDIITSEINYGTGGRPCILYKKKNGKLV